MDPTTQSPAAAEVAHTEALWARAHETLDLDLIEQLMAEEYAIVHPDGRVVERAETLASYRSGQRHWDLAESTVLNVRIYSETAVVLGQWRARGRNGDEGFDYVSVYTSVQVKRDGHWQIVAQHVTPGIVSNE